MQINFHLIYPMFALVVLTYFVALIMVVTRFRAVMTGEMKADFFKTYQGAAPDLVVKVGRHFSNLFETPVLYYAACIVAMVIPIGGTFIESCAWLYVLVRLIHAFVHIGPNKLKIRMRVFLVSVLILLAMWIKILLSTPLFG